MSRAAEAREQDARIRGAILRALHDGPRSNQGLAQEVEQQTGIICSVRSVTNMVPRLGRAGWVSYNAFDLQDERHYLTDAGRDVVTLLFGARR